MESFFERESQENFGDVFDVKKTDDNASFTQHSNRLRDIKQAAQSNSIQKAIALLNDNYAELSSSEIDKAVLLLVTAIKKHHTLEPDHALSLAEILSSQFDRIDTWQFTTELSVANKRWVGAINASLNWLRLEYQPDKIEYAIEQLIRLASQQRAVLERDQDHRGILSLYKQLHDSQPNSTRLQYELALSYLRVNQPSLAKPLLEQLGGSEEYSALAESALDRLSNTQLGPDTEPLLNKEQKRELVVPLIRSGTNLLAKANINGQNLILLLDTGASITALNQSTINQIGLVSTGKAVTLSTANGSRNAQLYKAPEFTLAGLNIKNLVIAEVDMPASSPIQGLLGTDVLNLAGDDFDYLIDNANNQLVFREK